ncbi:ATP-dependent DNA ligase [Amycolatopsis benzoatilytica]|uniref:ATP-dependent DNA ligase n=1 Tax=Amycolatopsis benzoatilytica TaxID=346045 RepID=UPI00037F7D9F|nr:ATP-dependent DNA ligase [Amycolatopsis benzoatilytica]
MLFTELVTASAELAATRSRKAKIAVLASILRAAEPGELPAVIAYLTGQTAQDRLGAGWRTLADLAVPPAAAATVDVAEVDAALAEVAAAAGAGSVKRRADVLGSLFARLTRAEQEFVFRLVTGELRQGALEGVMVDAIAAAAEVGVDQVRRAFMLSGRLPVTGQTAITGGAAALAEFRLELGRPVRPMLASPAESLEEAEGEHANAIVEYKMDGARIQVHRRGSQVRVYTRTLREITGSVTELVELVRALPCESVVLDGETLALTDDGRPRPFQETMSRFGSTRDEQVRALLLRPYFFDCLHLDGVDLLDAPLSERHEALRRAAGEHVIPGAIRPSSAASVLDAAMAAGHEGVMVKDLDSAYAAGRRGRAWLKVKPVHTIDLVVLAAEWGHGRRTGKLSNLHLGARDPDGGPPIMVGKTFKGLTDELLAWQTERFQEIEIQRDRWTVHVRPETVVEIELDGAQVSTRYPGGLALRFARVVRYRPDKDPGEADTIDTVRGLLRGARPEAVAGETADPVAGADRGPAEAAASPAEPSSDPTPPDAATNPTGPSSGPVPAEPIHAPSSDSAPPPAPG